MIFYSGLGSVDTSLLGNDNQASSLEFEPVDPDQIRDTDRASVFLLGPREPNPVQAVQKIYAKDKHLSIVILAYNQHYNKIRQALSFSPFVGKNVTCVAFNPQNDYSSLIRICQTRTKQKRGFSKLKLGSETMLSRISSPAIKLDNLENTLEHAPVGVLLLNPEGLVIGANRLSRRMFAQLSGSQVPLKELFAAQYISEINGLISEGKSDVLEAEDLHGNYYELTISNVREGEDQHVLLLLNDITERREKDRKLEAILESLPQMAWVATPEGNVNYYTHGWYSYTNQRPEDALNEGWMSVVHPDDLTITVARWNEAIRNHSVYQHASRFRKFDGEYRWHLSRAVPVLSVRQTIIMWVGTSTDVHDQVMLAENLERKVKERTRSLEAANEELEQFAYVSSHDLQEPLRKIQTFADLIRESSCMESDEASRKYLEKIIGTASRMSKLLKDLLSFTKLHQREKVTPVNLNEIVGGIREDLELVISQTGASLEVKGTLPVIQGYSSQLKQLFFNLVNNSLKFRDPDRRPVVEIMARRVSDDLLTRYAHLSPELSYWEFVVQDNGIGFDQKYADQIFTIFQRLHNRAAYEGTGIGLAICRKAVANHNGEIYAVSSPGNGAAFHIILPE